MSEQTIKFANLEITIKQSASEVTYTFKGDVDENFRQQDVPRIASSTINLQLDEIVNFNSCGIREWIYLIKDMGRLGSLVFKGCSVTMVDQINMVPDSLGTGVIESFYAPYYCSTHGEINQLIHVSDAILDLQAKRAPEFKCPHCNNALDFDALEESYFLFADSGLQRVS
jgi:hypothetical protein